VLLHVSMTCGSTFFAAKILQQEVPRFAPEKALFAPLCGFCHIFYGIVELRNH